LGKGAASTAAPRSEAGGGGKPDFLALLLAGLEPEPEVQATEGEAPPETTNTGSRTPAKKNDGFPEKAKSKEQLNEVAFTLPLPVAVPLASQAAVLPCMIPDSRTSGDSGAPVTAVVNGLLPGTESVATPSVPIPAKTTSGTDAGGAAPGSKPSPEGAQGPAPAQGETAFEASIQLPVSGVPDQPAARNTASPADRGVAADPIEKTSNTATGPVIAAPSHAGTTPAGDRQDAGSADPVRPSQGHGAQPVQGKASAADESGQDSGAQEQQNSAGPAKDSGEPARQPLDDSPRAADPPVSVAAFSAAPATGGSAGVTAAKSEPPAPPVAGDTAPGTVAAPPASAPSRDISIQLQDPGGPRVDVQLMDRAGTVHVVVRTQDDGLAKDLRTNLPELAQKLSQQGMEADAWSPLEMHNTPGGQENPGHAHQQTADDANSSPGGQGSEGSGGDRSQHQRPDPEDEFNRDFTEFLTGVTAWQPTR
jgi:hypothetical protein